MSGASRRDALKLAGAMAIGGSAVVAGLAEPGRTGTAEAASTSSGRFSLEIDGVIVAGIVAVEHPTTESEYLTRDGEFHWQAKPSMLSLTKDWSNTAEFFRWRKTVLDGKTERKSISVIFHNDDGTATRMNFYNCWPSKWVGPSLNAKNTGHAMETIEVVFETMELKLL